MSDYERLKEILGRCASRGFVRTVVKSGSPGKILLNRYAVSNHMPRVIICLEGSRRHSFFRDDELIDAELQPGDAVVIPPNCWIKTWYTESNRSLSMVFGPGYIRLLHLVGRSSSAQACYYHGTSAPEVQFPFELPKDARALLHVLMSVEENETGDSGTACPEWFHRDLMRCFLWALHLGLPPKEPSRPSKAEQTWRRVTGFISEHCQEDIDRVVTALEMKLHENHVSRLFAEHGTTFTRYLNEQRVERARSMLRQNDLPVAQVGFLCGFNSANYFSRVFKNVTGLTPLEYRESMNTG